MGLFSLFKKKDKINATSKQILSMIMYDDLASFNSDKLIQDLKTSWGIKVQNLGGESGASVFNINGERVTILSVDKPIPWEDIKGTGRYAWNWENWEKQLKGHNGHVIVSLSESSNNQLNRYVIFTMVLNSILKTSLGIGVYNGKQSLLTPREYYIKSSEGIKQKSLPVELWVYTGINNHENGNNFYTYGLKTFGKKELEIINSNRSNEELHSILHQLIFYLIGHNAEFADGHTFNLPSGEPAKVKEVHGVHNDEIVHRLEF